MDPKYAQKVYVTVIELLKLYTKKEMDDLYAEVLKETLSYFT
jgi:hypothetical protein